MRESLLPSNLISTSASTFCLSFLYLYFSFLYFSFFSFLSVILFFLLLLLLFFSYVYSLSCSSVFPRIYLISSYSTFYLFLSNYLFTLQFFYSFLFDCPFYFFKFFFFSLYRFVYAPYLRFALHCLPIPRSIVYFSPLISVCFSSFRLDFLIIPIYLNFPSLYVFIVFPFP